MIFFPFTIILVRSYEDELSVLVIFKGVCLTGTPPALLEGNCVAACFSFIKKIELILLTFSQNLKRL